MQRVVIQETSGNTNTSAMGRRPLVDMPLSNINRK